MKYKKVSSYVLAIYVFAIFCIYPFYFENGYYNIGIAKCKFFYSCSLITVITVIALAIIKAILKQRENIKIKIKNISITEKFIYYYMGAIIISFLLSPFKKEILWGAEGWYMGTFPLLIMSVLAIAMSYIWEEQEWMIFGGVFIPGVIFLLGSCNRFSYYPIPIEPHHPGFVSMLGNINWFCGYMSVIAPLGTTLFVGKKKEEYSHKWHKWCLMIYTVIIFCTGFCQGSESVFVWNLALFLALFCIAVKNTERLKNWFLLLSLWGFSGQAVRGLIRTFPEKYTYDRGFLVDADVTLVIALVAIILYIILELKWKEDKETDKRISVGIICLVLGGVFIGALVWLVLAIYNTKVGISFLKNNALFVLNRQWGNGRGIIFQMSFAILENMSPIQVLFGVGADGYSAFAYSVPEIEATLYDYFGASILTNAHCEILTNLINLGVLGTFAFLAVFITFVIRCIKKGEENILLYSLAVSIICYFANNLVSFSQVLNTPYLFILLGIGESYLRRGNENAVKCNLRG